MGVLLLLVTFFAVVRGSLLEQHQGQLNEFGRSILTMTTEMQDIQQSLLEGLNGELVPVFIDANSEIARIRREAEEFVKDYNMTDPYCIEVVGYMLWAREEEAVEAVQLCAEEVVGGIEEAWLMDILEQAREKNTEMIMVVLRELSGNGDMGFVEMAVGEEMERIKIEWSEMIGVMKISLARLSQFRQVAAQQTKNCTTEAIEQFDFHMGFLRYYMNKNDHCRR